ncbi:hypothetical protein [Arthrobacter sp. NPDC089319]|uniref:PH-like domain-containing protein n=1 Tax=Arthrobacter sp. NPDC089319 TaxID=3155915 RepID=UPI003421C31B
MNQLQAGLVMLAVAVVLLVLVAVGWRNRLKRQQDIAPLPQIPADTANPTGYYEGMYVVTTTAGDWLDRVAVHGLGVRTKAALRTYPHGVLIERPGSTDVYIPAAAISGVRTESGMVGKFVESEGLAVITWKLGERDVDTAFRTRQAADKQPLLAQLQTYLPAVQED